MSYEIRNGIYVFINGTPMRIPHDENNFPVSVLYAVSETSRFPIPIKTTADGKLIVEASLGPISIGSITIKDESLERYVNIVVDNENALGIKGFMVFGKNTNDKIKSLLFDLNGNLKTNDEYVGELLEEIKSKLNNLSFNSNNQLLVSETGLTEGNIYRENDEIKYVEFLDNTSGITKRTTFIRDANGDIISWKDEIV